MPKKNNQPQAKIREKIIERVKIIKMSNRTLTIILNYYQSKNGCCYHKNNNQPQQTNNDSATKVANSN